MKSEEQPLSQKPLIPEGPWHFVLNEASNSVMLQSEKSGRDTVMDFVRYGMQLAQPRFNVEGRMVKAQDLGVTVEGREHHAEWFKYINHPVAKAIERLPELLKAEQERDTWKQRFDRADDRASKNHAHVNQLTGKISELEETISKKDAKLGAILKGLANIRGYIDLGEKAQILIDDLISQHIK